MGIDVELACTKIPQKNGDRKLEKGQIDNQIEKEIGRQKLDIPKNTKT